MPRKSAMKTVRLSEEDNRKLNWLCKHFNFRKSDFIRECIKKLIDDNEILLKHYEKKRDYIDYIKNELAKISKKRFIEVKNGPITDACDKTIYILCDLLWGDSEKVFDEWLMFSKQYNKETKEVIDKRKEGETLLDFNSVAVMALGRETKTEPEDIVEEKHWFDPYEDLLISLLVSVMNAFRKHGVENVVKEALDKITKEEGKPQRLVIDVKGNFSVSGRSIIIPVEYKDM